MSQHDTYIARIAQIRQRFRREPEARSRLDAPKKALRFFALSVRKAHADDLGQQSAALAFITLMALVPTLTALSIVAAGAFGEREGVVKLLAQILPYSEATIVDKLTKFLEKTSELKPIGLVFFLVSALAAFTYVERTVNRIWSVPHNRPFRTRLVSFTLVSFWGSILIATIYSDIDVDLSWLGLRFANRLPTELLPFAVTLVGLTMLYWVVPYTTVRFRSAFFGGLVAAALLEGLRGGFGIYAAKVPTVSVVYGSLGLVFFFMISVQLSWWIVLLGSEVGYCLQHHEILTRERRHAAPLEGSWLALLALVVIAERFRDGEPIVPHEHLAERLQLRPGELLEVLGPLVEAGYLRETGGDAEGFLLAQDPHEVRVASVFELYERDHWELLDPLGETIATPLEELRATLTEGRVERSREMVLTDLVRSRQDEPPGSS